LRAAENGLDFHCIGGECPIQTDGRCCSTVGGFKDRSNNSLWQLANFVASGPRDVLCQKPITRAVVFIFMARPLAGSRLPP